MLPDIDDIDEEAALAELGRRELPCDAGNFRRGEDWIELSVREIGDVGILPSAGRPDCTISESLDWVPATLLPVDDGILLVTEFDVPLDEVESECCRPFPNEVAAIPAASFVPSRGR